MTFIFGTLFPLIISGITSRSKESAKLPILRALQKSVHRINAMLTFSITIASIIRSHQNVSILVCQAHYFSDTASQMNENSAENTCLHQLQVMLTSLYFKGEEIDF